VKDGVTDADVTPFKLINFPGGLYAMAVSIDEDDESILKVQDKIVSGLKVQILSMTKAVTLCSIYLICMKTKLI